MFQDKLYKIENLERVPSGIPDWDYQHELLYIEGLGGIPICVEVNSPSKNYKTASAELVGGLTRKAMQDVLTKNCPDFFIDDLYTKDGYMYAQLRRKVMV